MTLVVGSTRMRVLIQTYTWRAGSFRGVRGRFMRCGWQCFANINLFASIGMTKRRQPNRAQIRSCPIAPYCPSGRGTPILIQACCSLYRALNSEHLHAERKNQNLSGWKQINIQTFGDGDNEARNVQRYSLPKRHIFIDMSTPCLENLPQNMHIVQD